MSVKVKYCFLQGFTWAEYVILTGYCTYYLSSYGFSDTVIGAINSVFAAIAIVATFLLGRLADSSRIFHWRKQSLIIASIMLILMTALLFVREKWFIGPTFGFMYLLLCAINTMVNAASFYYEAKEVDVNFGLARGIGSATYAVFSTFVGRLTLAYGRIVVPAAGVLITFLLTLVILSMPYSGSVVEDSKDSSAKKADMNWIRLISKYPVLSLIVLANFFLIIFHNMYCSYMIRIVEKVGGDSNSLGLSLAIGAIFELPMMLAAVWMVKKIPDKLHIVMLLGSLGFLLRGGLFILATHMSHIYLAQMTSMFGYAVYASVGIYFVNRLVEPEDMVTGQAEFAMSISAASVISSFAGGLLIDAYGINQMLLIGFVIASWGTVSAAVAAIIYNKGKSNAIKTH